jgi:hypothetical protein
VVGGSVSQLFSLGWSKEKLKPGQQVQIGFRPMKDGSRRGQIMNIRLLDGEKLCSNRRLRRRHRPVTAMMR